MRKKEKSELWKLEKEENELFGFIKRYLGISETPPWKIMVIYCTPRMWNQHFLHRSKNKGQGIYGSEVEVRNFDMNNFNDWKKLLGRTQIFLDSPEKLPRAVICLNLRRIKSVMKERGLTYEMGITLCLVHEMIHILEQMTGTFYIKFSDIYDGYSIPIYEALVRDRLIGRKWRLFVKSVADQSRAYL